MKNTREIGLELENYVANTLKPYDKSAKPSKQSGAGNYKEDIYLTKLPLAIECKNYQSKNISLPKSVWNKCIKNMSIVDKRKPILVTTVEGIQEPFAMLRWSDLVQLMVNKGYEKED